MTLFAEYNSPYLFAIAFVFFIGVLEMISLIFGHFLSGALDAHLDHYDALSSGPAGQALHYLNIGRVPALVVLCLLAGYFGLFGILIQHGGIMLWGGNHFCTDRRRYEFIVKSTMARPAGEFGDFALRGEK